MYKKITRLFSAVVTKKTLLLFLHAQNILSIIVVFSSPLPLRPKTSIGMLTGTSIIIVALLILLYKKKEVSVTKPLFTDWMALGFVAVNAVSLLGSPYVFETTTFRLLLSAVVQYVSFRLVSFSSKEQRTTMMVVGVTTVFVAAMSLFQVVFRPQAIVVAKKYLFGDAAFSLSWDLARGRAPQWGNIVVSFPLWMASLFLLQKEKGRLSFLYKVIGWTLVPFSFIVSNFRWLTACFLIGLALFILSLARHKLVSFVAVRKIGIMVGAVFVASTLLASVVFKYNIIDRLLLKEKQRDVVFTLGRSFLYQQAVSAFLSSPLIGIGTGNYRHIVERPVILHFYDTTNQSGESSVVETDREPVTSHNEMLTVLAETGVLGLGTLVLLGYAVVLRLFGVIHKMIQFKTTHLIVYPLAFLVSILMYFLIGLFENMAPNVLVLLFFIYAASVTWFSETSNEQKQLKR